MQWVTFPFAASLCSREWQKRSHARSSQGWPGSKRCSHQVRAVTFLNENRAAVTLGENQIGRPHRKPEGSCLAWALCIAEGKKNQKQGKGRACFMSVIFLWALSHVARSFLFEHRLLSFWRKRGHWDNIHIYVQNQHGNAVIFVPMQWKTLTSAYQ